MIRFIAKKKVLKRKIDKNPNGKKKKKEKKNPKQTNKVRKKKYIKQGIKKKRNKPMISLRSELN